MSLGSRGLMQFLGGNWKVQVQGVHLHSQFLHIYDSTTTSTYSMRGEHIPMDVQCKTSLRETPRHGITSQLMFIVIALVSLSHAHIHKYKHNSIQWNSYCFWQLKFFFPVWFKIRIRMYKQMSVMTCSLVNKHWSVIFRHFSCSLHILVNILTCNFNQILAKLVT